MQDNTKVNLNISDQHQLQMSRHPYLISKDKKFSNQFSVYFLINR